MNNDELIAAGHELAKCLDSNTPLLDIGKLLSKMATQLDVTTAALREKTKQCAAEHNDVLAWEKTMFKVCGEDGTKSVAEKFASLEASRAALAAENGQMLRLLTDISENHDEYVNQDEYLYAGVPMDYVSEINAYVSRDVEAENPFKATDAFLREVRASAVDAACLKISNSIVSCRQDEMIGLDEAVNIARNFAAELRQGGAA
ncbi:hypothetical protein SMX72_003259 [Cronobacter sakazakii]|nr:hypothetical protein [Cronobacter sakazakii]